MSSNLKNLEIQATAIKPFFPERFHGVVVSASGGLDSTALFHALWRLNKAQFFFPMALFHMHYGLRGEESDADFRFVEALALDHGVPFFRRVVTDGERRARTGESLQEWARRLRYAELEKLAGTGWAVATAHHADDLAENVLLRLARGAAPGQWLGMEVWRPPFWKPLLTENKATLAAFLAKEGLAYREDATNKQSVYSRNVIRHEVLPCLEQLHPGAARRLVQAAEEARDLACWLDTKALDELGTPPEARRLASLPLGVARHVLARFLSRDGEMRQLSRRLLDRILDTLKDGAAKGAWDLPHHGRLVVRDGILSLESPDLSTQPPKAARQNQHRQGLQPPACDLVLEPGSHASLRGNPGLSAFPSH